MTDAEVNLAGREARLTKKGKTLRAKILSPAGALFTVQSARQAAPQCVNEGFQQLVIKYTESRDVSTISVLLSVESTGADVVQLDKWGRE
jgi:hypothetical protein